MNNDSIITWRHSTGTGATAKRNRIGIKANRETRDTHTHTYVEWHARDFEENARSTKYK